MSTLEMHLVLEITANSYKELREHIIGHFKIGSLQAIDCTGRVGTDNQTRTKQLGLG